jgi:hypothetical protein
MFCLDWRVCCTAANKEVRWSVFKVHGIRPQLLGLVAAAAVPFLILIGIGLWNQWRAQQAEALQRAHAEARVIAARVDDHIGDLENLMVGLSLAVSTNPSDVEANDALLRRLLPDLPRYIANVVVVGLDGENIGHTHGHRYNVRDRDYIQRVLAGERLVVGDPREVGNFGPVFPVARAVKNVAGELQAVLVVGTVIDSVQEALRVDELPPGSVVRIISDRRIGIARFPEVPVAVLPGCGDPLAASEIVGLMLARLAAPYEIAEHVLHLGASAGLAIAPLHGSNFAELLSNADLALYQAKKDGGRMRSAESSVQAPSSMRSRRARSRPRLADGSSQRLARRLPHGARADVPWGGLRSICSPPSCAIRR